MPDRTRITGPNEPPVLNQDDPLAVFWSRPVAELASVSRPALTPWEKERHTIFSLLAMAIVFDNYNGNCKGAFGEYPQRKRQALRNKGIYRGDRFGDRYLGHNIAAIAVDGAGHVIDFELNHNDLFDSSVEHAESRLLRRIFSLAQRYRHRLPGTAEHAHHFDLANPEQIDSSDPYYTILNNVTIYTTLEPCAQCAGMMALAQVKEVVYLQHDPGQALIASILFNLCKGKIRAPRPRPASDFDFPFFDKLNERYREFYVRMSDPTSPDFFFRSPLPGSKPQKTTSLTSFLCTDEALGLYRQAHDRFYFNLKLASHPAPRRKGLLSNAQALRLARSFGEYVQLHGRRGTPHRV